MGYVLHSKQKKKENEAILEKFAKDSCGVINSSKALNTGTDIPGLSVGIMLANTSSKITKQQSIGRCIRKEGDKIAEFFTLLIKGTQEVN
jgi:superfamily II DNA or RNA helicase